MISDKEKYMLAVNSASEYIKNKITGSIPEICVVLGSGLSPLANDVTDRIEIPYADIPNFPVSTVVGHDGKMIIGKLSGKDVIMMSGRFHFYEGYDTSECTFYVRVMSKLGVKTLVLTNAAGGILEGMKPAELMAIEDHISFLCDSPLRGPNLDEFGVRFPDQSFVYDREYLDILAKCADELGIKLHRGVYAYTRGPQYETPAEIRLLKMLGAGTVGMSTAPEAIVASHCGMRIAAVSCVTNMAAGITKEALTHDEVMMNATKASSDNCALVRKFVESI